MPYRISEFDGLAIPEFLQRGDTQSIGTGTARSDMLQLPGGRFYDNQGTYDSPRMLDPITKRCVVHATAGSTVRAQMDALRAKIGKRGVLEVLWHDAEVRWQYARLVRMRSVRPRGTAFEWLPVDLQFMPSQGFWYDTDQTVDDTTFPGATGNSETVVINNAGNARATEVEVEYECPTTEAALRWVIRNTTNGTNMHFGSVGTPLSVTANDLLVFDTAEKWAYHMEGTISIDTMLREQNEGGGSSVVCNTDAAHGLSVDDVFRVEGNGVWDGFWTVTIVDDADTVHAWLDPQFTTAHTATTSGDIRKCNSLWSEDKQIHDLANWFYLEPGNNSIFVTTPAINLDAGTLTVTFYDTYA